MFYWPNKCLLSLLLKSSSYSIIQTFIHFYIPLTHHLSVRVYSRNIPGCCPIPYNLSMTARKHARKTEGNLISSFLVSMQYSRSDSSLELANRTLQSVSVCVSFRKTHWTILGISCRITTNQTPNQRHLLRWVCGKIQYAFTRYCQAVCCSRYFT